MVGHPLILSGSIFLPLAALIAMLFWALPQWSRPGIFFSVTVLPGFAQTEEARTILRGYRLHALAHVAIAAVLILGGALTQRFPLLILGLLWMTAGPLAAVSAAHKKALRHAMPVPSIREAVLVPHPRQLPGGWLAQFGPYGVLLVTALYLRARWDEIPDRFPVHWGVNGEPNGWSSKTPLGVFGPLLFGAGIIAVISVLGYAVSHTARNVEQAMGATRTRSYPHRIAIFMLGVEFFIAAMFAMVGLLPFTGSPGVLPLLMFPLIILAGAILLRGWLSHRNDVAAHDGTGDASWKLGLFYFNPDDSALFVEKRIGIGYTLNFARPAAWLVLAAAVLLPLGLAFAALSRR